MIDLAPYDRLRGVWVDGAGRLYVLGETDNVLARFDAPVTHAVPSQLVPVGGARSHYLVVRRDGARAYVADTMSDAVIMIDPQDMGVALVPQRIGVVADGLALSRDEMTLYAIDRPAGVIHALDIATLAPLVQRTMRGEELRFVTLPDGRLVVSNTADKSLPRLDPARRRASLSRPCTGAIARAIALRLA